MASKGQKLYHSERERNFVRLSVLTLCGAYGNPPFASPEYCTNVLPYPSRFSPPPGTTLDIHYIRFSGLESGEAKGQALPAKSDLEC